MFRKILFLVAFCGLCASCSTKQELDSRDSERTIRLGAGGVATGETPRTKVEVNSLADLAKAGVGDNIGIYGVSVGSNNTAAPTVGWGGECPMDNVRTSAVSATTGNISWPGVYLYPVDDSYVKFCAYYPYATAEGNGRLRLEAPATGRAPFLRFTLGGEDDIMYATPVSGRYDAKPEPLEFNHVLTQLHFQIVDEGGALIGAKIQNIVLLDVNTSSAMNIETGALSTWESNGTLNVQGINEVEIEDNNPKSVGRGITLQPGQASFRVRVETTVGNYTATIRPTSTNPDGSLETEFAAGHSYTISLLFDRTAELSASAVVTPWLLMGYDDITIQ